MQLVQHCNNFIYFLFLWRNSPNHAQVASLLRFLDHTQLDKHTPGSTPLYEWSARRTGRYLHNTQQTYQTDIHIFSGIRTRDPSNRANADLPLRPHSQRDRSNFNYGSYYYVGYYWQYSSNSNSSRISSVAHCVGSVTAASKVTVFCAALYINIWRKVKFDKANELSTRRNCFHFRPNAITMNAPTCAKFRPKLV